MMKTGSDDFLLHLVHRTLQHAAAKAAGYHSRLRQRRSSCQKLHSQPLTAS
jgi:hypothetical protein